MHKACYLVIVGIRLVWQDLFLMNINWLLLFSYYPLGTYKLLSYLFQYFCGNVTLAKSVHLLQYAESLKDKHCIFSFKESIPNCQKKKKSGIFLFWISTNWFCKKPLQNPKNLFYMCQEFMHDLTLHSLTEWNDRYLRRFVVQALLYLQNCNSVAIALSTTALQSNTVASGLELQFCFFKHLQHRKEFSAVSNIIEMTEVICSNSGMRS